MRPEYVCNKLRLTGQSWDSALALQRVLLCGREAEGKRSHLHLDGGGEGSSIESEAPLWLLRPGLLPQIDLFQLVALPGSVPCLSPETDGERRAKEEREGISSLFGTSIRCGCVQLVYRTPNTAVGLRAALKVQCAGIHVEC